MNLKPKKYNYSVLTYNHSAVLGEVINIGVIIYFPDSHRFDFIYSKNLTRIKLIYDVVSEKTVKNLLKSIEKALSKSEYNLFDYDSSIHLDEYIHDFFLTDSSSILKFSPFKSGVYYEDSQQNFVDNLSSLLIFEKEKTSLTVNKEPIMIKQFSNKLELNGLAVDDNSLYKNYSIKNGTGVAFQFDFAWINKGSNSTNLIKPISFDLKESKGIAEKAYKNFGLFTDLSRDSDYEGNYKYDLLIEEPIDKSLHRDYFHAVDLLKTLKNVQLIEESFVDSYIKSMKVIINQETAFVK